jgi:hypothetical protein
MKETTKVRVGLKYVRNLGNYESIHVDIGIEDWVRDSDQGTSSAVDRVYAFVEGKLLEKMKSIEEEINHVV